MLFNTLRSAIAAGIYVPENKLWREIINVDPVVLGFLLLMNFSAFSRPKEADNFLLLTHFGITLIQCFCIQKIHTHTQF